MNGNQNTEYNKLYQKILELRNREGGAINHMGVRITDLGPGWAKGEIKTEDYHLNPIGSIHGGVLFFLADSVAGSAASTRGSAVTTSNGFIHFLNPAIGVKKLVAEAIEMKAGKNLLTYDVIIRTEKDKIISKATMEYYNLHVAIDEIDEKLGAKKKFIVS